MTQKFNTIKDKIQAKAENIPEHQKKQIEEKLNNAISEEREQVNVNEFRQAMGGEIIDNAFEAFRTLVKNGDRSAVNTCIRKLFPDPKPKNFININIPNRIETLKDLTWAYNEVILNMFNGNIALEDASLIMGILNSRKELLLVGEIEPRLKLLEEALSQSHVIDNLENQKMDQMQEEISFLKDSLDEMTQRANQLQRLVEKEPPEEKVNQNGFKRYVQ